MQLSIIIVNYNVCAFLESALIAVRKAIGSMHAEVIVVDNASSDGSVEMMCNKFPDIRLIVNEQNVGFAKANNIALKVCCGKHILLLNPDTLVQEDTFRIMLEYLEAHPQIGLAGCKTLNPDGTLQLACRRSFPTPWVALTKILGLSSLFPHTTAFGKYNLTYLPSDQTYEVDAVSGSFMFLRREVYETIGGLDEEFFMYGEDLDWCYRIQQAGWKIAYIPSTQIIHYKGQSARRSDIDEVKLFYQAMRLFVKKHFRYGVVFEIVIRVGIALRQLVAFAGKTAKPLRATALDFVLINLSLILSEWIWFGKVLRFPSYAYPIIITAPWLVLSCVMYWSGVYTNRRHSGSRAATSVVIGYIVLSALTFFFKQYGFSRMVVLISGAMSLLLLPGWRLVARTVLRTPEHRRKSLFGRRTIIVGTNASGQEVLRKLRTRIDDGYEIVGFIDNDRKRVGEKVTGVEILGTIDNIGKVIEEQRASEVIFSTDTLSYAEILSVISRSRNRSVNYRLVPSSLEVIIGKTHIDELDDVPLVDIEYNIDRFANRIFKRVFDLIGASVLMIAVYPIIAVEKRTGASVSSFGTTILQVPMVLKGEMSLVGPQPHAATVVKNGTSSTTTYLGKTGLTGLAQLHYRDDLHPEEIERYNVYYAKNQSLMLDMEILLKTGTMLLRH